MATDKKLTRLGRCKTDEQRKRHGGNFIPARRWEFMALDIESKDGPSQRAGFTRPFLVGLYTGESYHQWRNKNEKGRRRFWERNYYEKDGCLDLAMRFICQEKYAGKLIYAHNGGSFDFLFMAPWLKLRAHQLGLAWEMVPVSSQIQLIVVTKVVGDRKLVWRFLDSVKLLPMSLVKAAKTFGLPGKIDHDLNLHEADPNWTIYLRQDCWVLYRIMEHYHKIVVEDLLGEVGFTSPSTAMKLYRRRYLHRDLERSVASHDFVRESYCGGRVEVYKHEAHWLRYYDFNSSYPASMKEKMPAGKAIWCQGKPPARFTDTDDFVGFCRAKVRVPESLYIPPLPIKGDGKHLPQKLVFPVGKLYGVWEWSELQMALEVGCEIEEWEESVWYHAEPLFVDFVDDLYRYRDKDLPGYNEGLSMVAKLLMCALYGKFAQKLERQRIFASNDPRLKKYLKNQIRPCGGDDETAEVCVVTEEVDQPYVMPQISARITARSRVRLYRAMQSADFDVAYIDTDSLLTPRLLPTSNKLGDLKDEYPAYSGGISGYFYSPKLYQLICGDLLLTKAKGVCPMGSTVEEKQAHLDELMMVLAQGGQIEVQRLEKIGTLAQANFDRGPRVIAVPRTLLRHQEKRQVLPDGINTKPLYAQMW